MTAEIVFIGAGGHAKVLLEALRLSGDTRNVVAIDPARVGERLLDATAVNGDGDLTALAGNGTRFFVVAIGAVGDNGLRTRLFADALSAGLEPLTVVHPSSILSPNAALQPGAQLLAGAIVNAGARVGQNTIVNTGAIIEHDCTIGAHVHIATGARLAGGVEVGDRAHIGAGATVRHGIHIGVGALVGAGAVVVKSVVAGARVAGVPAKELS